jgi:hypothetical protein
LTLDQVEKSLKKHEGVWNCYWTVNISKNGGRKKTDMSHARYAHVDLDPHDGETPAQAKARYTAKFQQWHSEGKPEPWVVIDSGGGIQATWVLGDLIELDGDNGPNTRRVEALNARLALWFGGDSKCKDISRVLRVPGPINLPNDKKIAAGRGASYPYVLHWGETCHTIEQLEAAVADVEIPTFKESIGQSNSKSSFNPDAGGTPAPRFADGTIDLDNIPGINDYYIGLIRGDQEKTDGEDFSRSGAAYAVIMHLVERIPDREIVEIFMDERYPIGERYRERGDYAYHAIEAEIVRARDKGGYESPPRPEPPPHAEPPKPRGPNEIEANGKRSSLVCVADVKSKPVDWIWHKQIARGQFHLNTGNPDCGKSLQQIDYAAILTKRGMWPDGTPAPLMDVLFITFEDDWATAMRPRLIAAGADVSRCHYLDLITVNEKQRRAFLLAEDLDVLKAHIDHFRSQGRDLGVICVSPITSVMGNPRQKRSLDSHSATDVRGVLDPLNKFAPENNVAVLAITHSAKKVEKAMDAFMGSGAFIQTCRVGTLTVREMVEGKPTGRYLLVQVRNSLAALQRARAYRIVGVEQDGGIETCRIEWEGLVDITADAALAASNPPKPEKPPKGESIERSMAFYEAQEVLKVQLGESAPNRDPDGWVPMEQVMAAVKAAGISTATLKRARLGLVAVDKRGFGKDMKCFWRLGGNIYQQEARNEGDPRPESDDSQGS